MALLDELKKQAQKAQEKSELASTSQLSQEASYQEKIKPAMRAILKYLIELTEQLEIVNPDAYHDYTLPGLGEVQHLKQGDYILKADSSEDTKVIRLKFFCAPVGGGEAEFPVTPRELARETEKFLDAQQMTYSEWPIRDSEQRVVGQVFRLRIRVEVNIIFKADLEKGMIQMLISNYSGFRIDRSTIPPERVTDHWLDQLGNYILRKNEDLHNLEIDDSAREAIRKMVEEDKKKRSKELRWAILRDLKEEEERKKHSLLGRLAAFGKKLTDKGQN